MDLFGSALQDFHNGDTSAELNLCRDDGNRIQIPAGVFFRGSTEYHLDSLALDHCRGRVLDVGAGTGLHSLALQERSFSVCAIDASKKACEVMQARGVIEVHCTEIFDFESAPFDTVLILGRTIGLVENLSGLDRFLRKVHGFVEKDGQILCSSMDFRFEEGQPSSAYREANRAAGRYFGEIRYRYEYKGRKGPSWGWLYVDPGTLAEHSLKADWSCHIIHQEEDGNYLARLTLLHVGSYRRILSNDTGKSSPPHYHN